jgi:hypothetical protein
MPESNNLRSLAAAWIGSTGQCHMGHSDSAGCSREITMMGLHARQNAAAAPAACLRQQPIKCCHISDATLHSAVLKWHCAVQLQICVEPHALCRMGRCCTWHASCILQPEAMAVKAFRASEGPQTVWGLADSVASCDVVPESGIPGVHMRSCPVSQELSQQPSCCCCWVTQTCTWCQ